MEDNTAAYDPPVNEKQPPPSEYYPAPQQFNDPTSGPLPPPVWTPQPQSGPQPVVMEQPRPVIVIRRTLSGGFLTLSIVLTILGIICCNWLSLICTIPAVVFAIMAKDADARGEYDKARTHGYISLGFNLAAIIAYAVIVAAIAASIIHNNSRSR